MGPRKNKIPKGVGGFSERDHWPSTLSETLAAYIRSDGKIAKWNLSEYARISRCPLCDEDLEVGEGQPIYIYRQSLCATRIDTECKMCDTCAPEVIAMEAEFKDYNGSRFQFDMEENKLKKFLKTGEIDEACATYYYTHQTESPHHELCYFCDSPNKAGRTTIQVPVLGTHTELTGGKLNVCFDCNNLSLLEGWDLKDNPVTTYPTDVCVNPDCKTIYPIDPWEFESRSNQVTLGKHYCPTCACTMLRLTISSSHVYYMDDVDGRADYRSRYKMVRCYACEEENMIDRSFHKVTTIKEHYRAKNYYCKECVFNGAVLAKVKLDRFPSVWYLLYQRGAKKFLVTKRNRGNTMNVTTFDLDGDLQDIIFSLLKHLNDGYPENVI